MIQTSPLPKMENMREYARLLVIRYVWPHYRDGTSTVHVIFDYPGGLDESPKQLEQSRRDLAKTKRISKSSMSIFSICEQY